MSIKNVLVVFAFSLFLTACGGSSSKSKKAPDDITTPPDATIAQPDQEQQEEEVVQNTPDPDANWDQFDWDGSNWQ